MYYKIINMFRAFVPGRRYRTWAGNWLREGSASCNVFEGESFSDRLIARFESWLGTRREKGCFGRISLLLLDSILILLKNNFPKQNFLFKG
jgi:hypothetical protein